jgi:hypothetical protein
MALLAQFTTGHIADIYGINTLNTCILHRCTSSTNSKVPDRKIPMFAYWHLSDAKYCYLVHLHLLNNKKLVSKSAVRSQL